jgi:predicted deacylase
LLHIIGRHQLFAQVAFMEIRSTPLLQGSHGTSRALTSFHFGRPGGQKIYIQSALHADEIPAMLVAVQIKQRLLTLEKQGALRAEIVLVPVANPVGLDQQVLGQFIGRFDLGTGQNFNRDFPSFKATGMGAIAAGDRAAIHASVRRDLDAIVPRTEFESLRLNLLKLSHDADVVLDLHCSLEAVMHLYTSAGSWPRVEPLARYLGAEVSLLSTDSGGGSFDETHSLFWWKLSQDADGAQVPHGCTAVTVECRGQRDVSDEMSSRDADAIINYLAWLGAVDTPPPALPGLLAEPTPLAGSEQFYAPASGILVHRARLGARIEAGDPLFDIVEPLTGARITVCSNTQGIFYMRRAIRFVQCGHPIGRVSGTVPIRTGKLVGL